LAVVACSAPGTDVEQQDAVVPINPLAEAESKEKATTRLYFGYQQQKLLVGESRVVDVTEFESIEKSIIEELAKGPSAERVDFTQLINPATQVVNIESQGQFLFITLSQEFLQSFGTEIDMTDEEQLSNEKRRRYLAVCSIVNSIVEQGTYSRVNILIDENGVGRPITLEEAGLDADEPAEPFERDNEIELTGRNTMREILGAIEKKEWSTLYGYIAYKNLYGSDKPSLEDFTNEIVNSKLAVSSSDVLDDVVSQDGSTDVVMVNYELKLQDGEPRNMTNIPVRLVQENGVWKITYNTFKSKFLT
jgi:spore germination protein GerM